MRYLTMMLMRKEDYCPHPVDHSTPICHPTIINTTFKNGVLYCHFNGKEKDFESGFHYYGARYYESELLTGWLGVDPMMDKYPSISPYAYCAWNPVKLVDPDGLDTVYSLATNLTNQDQNKNNRAILQWMRKVGDVIGMVTLCMHGSSQSVALSECGGGIEIVCDARNFATFVRKQSLPDYEKNKREDIRTIFLLYSCHTGNGKGSFAEQLSAELNEITIAPEGEIILNNKVHTIQNSASILDKAPKPWNVYYRGRKVTSFTAIKPKDWLHNMGEIEQASMKIVEMDRKAHPWE